MIPLIEKRRVEWWILGAGSWRNREMLVKGHSVAVIRMNKSRDLMFSIVGVQNKPFQDVTQ